MGSLWGRVPWLRSQAQDLGRLAAVQGGGPIRTAPLPQGQASNPKLTVSWQRPRHSQSSDYKKPHYEGSGAGGIPPGVALLGTRPVRPGGSAAAAPLPLAASGPHLSPGRLCCERWLFLTSDP